jgi:hypothetical protein
MADHCLGDGAAFVKDDVGRSSLAYSVQHRCYLEEKTVNCVIGRGEWIRTTDLLVPKHVPAHFCEFLSGARGC